MNLWQTSFLRYVIQKQALAFFFRHRNPIAWSVTVQHFKYRIGRRGRCTEPNIKAIPRVDRVDRKRQVNNLAFGEFFSYTLKQFAVEMPVAKACQGFSPFQRGTLAFAVPRCVTLRGQAREPVVAFPKGMCLSRMERKTKCAAIDLRCAKLDKRKQVRFEAGFCQQPSRIEERTDDFGCDGCPDGTAAENVTSKL